MSIPPKSRLNDAIDLCRLLIRDKISRKSMLEPKKTRVLDSQDRVEHSANGAQETARSISPARKPSAQGPRYHAVVTGPNGATNLHELPAYGDDEAIALGLAAAEGHPVEVWDGQRLIERFNTATS